MREICDDIAYFLVLGHNRFVNRIFAKLVEEILKSTYDIWKSCVSRERPDAGTRDLSKCLITISYTRNPSARDGKKYNVIFF